MNLIILASGKGSRLKRLTKNLPKCLLKIKGKSIIERILENSNFFKKKIIVTGYKSLVLERKLSDCIIVKNKDFYKSNMVHSLFKTKKYIKDNIIVTYADIIYSPNILRKLSKVNTTCIPLNNNWKKHWMDRMSLRKIYSDAENVVVKDDKIFEIGTKIPSKLPRYQFMGIIFIKKKDFYKMHKFYKSIKNIKVDMTTFLNLYIKDQKKGIKMISTNEYWYEIDNQKDYKVAKNSNHLKTY